MRAGSVILVCFMMLCLFGCGKKSGLEGKIVDGKGKSMSGVKVVVKQVQPIKGYEQFESSTGSDGGFKFGKLYPASAYELITYPDSTNKNLSVKIESSPKGQTKILPEPIVIRFLISKDGTTVTDTKTGLMWAKNSNISGSKMKWGQAMDWAKGLDIGGHKDWRLPTKIELGQMVSSGGREKPVPYLGSIGFANIQERAYWSSTTLEGFDSDAYVVGTTYDGGVFVYGKSTSDCYVWPVRSAQ